MIDIMVTKVHSHVLDRHSADDQDNRLDWCHIIECVDNIATLVGRARERIFRLNATNNN